MRSKATFDFPKRFEVNDKTKIEFKVFFVLARQRGSFCRILSYVDFKINMLSRFTSLHRQTVWKALRGLEAKGEISVRLYSDKVYRCRFVRLAKEWGENMGSELSANEVREKISQNRKEAREDSFFYEQPQNP